MYASGGPWVRGPGGSWEGRDLQDTPLPSALARRHAGPDRRPRFQVVTNIGGRHSGAKTETLLGQVWLVPRSQEGRGDAREVKRRGRGACQGRAGRGLCGCGGPGRGDARPPGTEQSREARARPGRVLHVSPRPSAVVRPVSFGDSFGETAPWLRPVSCPDRVELGGFLAWTERSGSAFSKSERGQRAWEKTSLTILLDPSLVAVSCTRWV